MHRPLTGQVDRRSLLSARSYKFVAKRYTKLERRAQCGGRDFLLLRWVEHLAQLVVLYAMCQRAPGRPSRILG